MTYNNVGALFDNQGKYDEALVEYRKCLAVQKAKLDKNHPDVAKTYNDIALVLDRGQGQYDEAPLQYYTLVE